MCRYEQKRLQIHVRYWPRWLRQSVEGGAAEDAYSLCHEGNAESPCTRQEKCALSNEREEILGVDLSSVSASLILIVLGSLSI